MESKKFEPSQCLFWAKVSSPFFGPLRKKVSPRCTTSIVIHAPEFVKMLIVGDHRIPAVKDRDIKLLPIVDFIAVRGEYTVMRIFCCNVLVGGFAA